MGLADDLTTSFECNGFVVLRGVLGGASLDAADAACRTWVERRQPPFELEAELGLPGAPQPEGEGADTVRRYLAVAQRGDALDPLLAEPALTGALVQLLGPGPRLVLAHHNCLMTKAPRHSSRTPWHRDLRYWSFSRGELVTAWIPLGAETAPRGALWVVPGSHRLELPAQAFDERQALREDEPAAVRALAQARPLELARGDLLLFHCRLLHTAQPNRTAEPKWTLVFTFRRPGDEPLAGTRSAAGGERALHGT